MDILALNLIKASIFALTAGFICYTIIAWHWSLRLCLMNTSIKEVFSCGLLGFILYVLDICLTLFASPFTYGFYLISTMTSAKLATYFVDTAKAENKEVNE